MFSNEKINCVKLFKKLFELQNLRLYYNDIIGPTICTQVHAKNKLQNLVNYLVARLQAHQLEPLLQRVGKHVGQGLHLLQRYIVREREIIKV